MKGLFAVLAVLVLSGCAGTGGLLSGGLCDIKENKSSFDDLKELRLTKCWSAKSESAWDFPATKIGFTWRESRPTTMTVNLIYDGSASGVAYSSYEALTVRINGKSRRFETYSGTQYTDGGYNDVSNNIYTQSQNSVNIPYALFEQMMTEKDVRLRVQTSDGYDDMIFHIPQNGTMKYTKLYAKTFYDRIETIKNAGKNNS